MNALYPHNPTVCNLLDDRMFHRQPYAWKCEHPQNHSCQICQKRPRDFAATSNREPTYDFVCGCTGWSRAAPFYRNDLECFEPEAPE